MSSVISSLCTVFLVLVSIFLVLVILMQRPSANAGMGATLGGGAAEMAFGSDTSKVLTKWTVRGIIAFFLIALLLSMSHIYTNASKSSKFDKIKLEQLLREDASVPSAKK